jgi:hypothetical protein
MQVNDHLGKVFGEVKKNQEDIVIIITQQQQSDLGQLM